MKIKYILSAILLLNSLCSHAQTKSEFEMPKGTDIFLLIIAIILLIPIRILASNIILNAKKKIDSMMRNKAPIVAFIVSILVFSTHTSVLAEAPVGEAIKAVSEDNQSFLASIQVSTWVLLFTILTEILVISFLSAKSLRFTKGVYEIKENRVANFKNWIAEKWNKINNFRPIEKESEIDTGHSYDGIRELNNPTPGWFKTAFIISIVVAVIYLYRYHISGSAPLQTEEYHIAMHEAEIEHQEYLKTAGEQIDENNIAPLTGSDIDAGKIIFSSNCTPCHGQDAQGINAPNLTDGYWLHGGTLADIFKSIKYGWVEKGMRSWKEDLKPREIAQVANYIVSLRNKNVKSNRAIEGILYVEKAVLQDSAAVVTDSIKK